MHDKSLRAQSPMIENKADTGQSAKHTTPSMFNNLNPKKLLNSKWTAVTSIDKQRHFLIVDVEYDEEQKVVECHIQAVMTKKNTLIDWRELKEKSKWQQGWK